jgi:hypothetical protein
LPWRVARLATVQKACPGGTTRVLTYRDEALITVYELPQPNTCAPVPAPPDRFADAIVLPGPRITDYTTTLGAGLDPGEPQPCAPTASTVWYAYNPRGDADIYVDTDGSRIPVILAAYARTDAGELQRIGCSVSSGTDAARLQVDPVGRGTIYVQVGHPLGHTPEPNHHIRINLSQPH